MKQGNVKWIAAFAMIAGVSAVSVRAEDVEIEDVNINVNSKNDTEIEDNELEMRNRVSGLGNTLQASPVIVTPAMAPTTQVPVALAAPATVLPAASLYQTQSASYPSQQTGGQEANNDHLSAEGTAQSSNSNAGSGAMVIINNTQDQKAAQDQLADQATQVGTRADMIRRERIRRELLNEGRLIEKIEENRIDTENSRSNSIEGMTFGVGAGGLESTDVVAVDGNNNNVEVVTAQVAGNTVVATDATDSSTLFGREVKLSPIAGYRWMMDKSSAFRVENQFIAGIALESKLANWVALEANYVFGRDKLKERGYGSSGYYGGAGHMSGYDYNGYDSMAYYVRERDSHEFSGNVKLGLLSGTIRPYGIVGIGMLLQKYRIDDQYTTAEASAAGWKRLFDDTVGNYGGGVDVKAGSNIALGARVEYQKVYGSKNTNLNDLYGHTEDRLRATGSVQILF